MERALGLAQLAVELDPLDYTGLANLRTTYWALGKPEEGLQYLIFDSENRWQRAMSTIVLHDLGRHEEERPIRQRMIDDYSDTPLPSVSATRSPDCRARPS